MKLHPYCMPVWLPARLYSPFKCEIFPARYYSSHVVQQNRFKLYSMGKMSKWWCDREWVCMHHYKGPQLWRWLCRHALCSCLGLNFTWGEAASNGNAMARYHMTFKSSEREQSTSPNRLKWILRCTHVLYGVSSFVLLQYVFLDKCHGFTLPGTFDIHMYSITT